MILSSQSTIILVFIDGIDDRFLDFD